MAQYTPKQYAAETRRRFKKILEKNIPLKIGVQDSVARMSERIFTEGKNSNDSKIGKYNDTKPLYANYDKIKGSSKLGVPRGKNGETVFKSGKNKGKRHKTKWFKSYKDLRAKLGRETSFVNLDFNGELKSDFRSNIKSPQIPSVHEYRVVMDNIDKYTGERSVKKIEGLENGWKSWTGYGKVFSLMGKEREKFVEIVNFELFKILSGG